MLFVVACDSPDSEGAEPPTSCANQVAAASQAIEVADQVALLDEAFLTCRSLPALIRELERYPGITGFDERTYVAQRCERIDDPIIAVAPVCEAVAPPTTTSPPTTVPELLFVGETLDGRQIELRPEDDVRFVEGVPAAIQQTVDIAYEDNCEGVVIQRDFWEEQIEAMGDEASVYAKHAENVMEFIGC